MSGPKQIKAAYKSANPPSAASNPAWANAYHDIGVLLAHIEAQEARIQELEDALAPVMSMVMWTDNSKDDEIVIMTAGTIRKMRQALSHTNTNEAEK